MTSTILGFDWPHLASITSLPNTYPILYQLYISPCWILGTLKAHTVTYRVHTTPYFWAISFVFWLGFVLCVPFSNCLVHQHALIVIGRDNTRQIARGQEVERRAKDQPVKDRGMGTLQNKKLIQLSSMMQKTTMHLCHQIWSTSQNKWKYLLNIMAQLLTQVQCPIPVQTSPNLLISPWLHHRICTWLIIQVSAPSDEEMLK